MQGKQALSVRFGMVFALALLLCAPMAMAQSGRVSFQGHVTGIVADRDGDGYRVTLDNGGPSYWVPESALTERNIRVGDFVRLDGYSNDGHVTVDAAVWLGGPNYTPYQRNYENRTYENRQTYAAAPDEGALTGTVQYVNRHYNYIDMRADGTGRMVRIDVRNMDTRGSVNVWRLRTGDHINVTGGWEGRGHFQADRVFF
ncbi:MAG TPA: hypothetical protein VF381_07950 [Thermoanaerobaculia bacterium]